MNKILPKMREYLSTNYLTRKNPYFRYGCKIWDVMIQTILLLFITAVVNIGLLYLCKMLWYIYISTPIGQQFVTISAGTSQVIFDILSRDFVSLSIKVTIAAFTICMLISAICQVLHIARYLYLPRGFFGKIALWGFPLTAVVATHIRDTEGFEYWSIAYAAALVPTLCIFTGCFKFTYELLPEIGDLIRKAALMSKDMIDFKLPKLTKQAKKLIARVGSALDIGK